MDNQHKHIKGYRDLSQQEIDLMNEGKALAEQCREYTEKLKALSFPQDCDGIDGRWLSIGVTQLQQGFMSVIRSIAKPTTF
jgi:hypothetical protein